MGNRKFTWKRRERSAVSCGGGKEDELSRSRKKGILVTGILVFIFALIIIKICLPLLELAETPEDFAAYIRETGARGGVRFFLIMVLQTLTMVIPAGPFEIASGAAFGAVKGTIICDAAIVCGNLIAFTLSRLFGEKYVAMFVSRETMEKHHFGRMTHRKKMIAALCFLIPGFPKDQMTYLLGMSDLTYREFLLMSAVFRLPTIILQVLSGDAFAGGQTKTSVVILLLSFALTAVGAFIYAKADKKDEREEK